MRTVHFSSHRRAPSHSSHNYHTYRGIYLSLHKPPDMMWMGFIYTPTSHGSLGLRALVPTGAAATVRIGTKAANAMLLSVERMLSQEAIPTIWYERL